MAELRRTVMLHDWYILPGISAEMLRAAYGERAPDPWVGFVALTVQY